MIGTRTSKSKSKVSYGLNPGTHQTLAGVFNVDPVQLAAWVTGMTWFPEIALVHHILGRVVLELRI